MPPRSLRRGDRQPMPGAVRKGCPRPEALRFASPFGGASPFGDGQPYGNITGAATFDAATGTWTVTGAATVDISPETDAAVLMARRIVVDGGVLTVPAKCKGLHIYASAGLQLLNGGRIHVDKLGKAGNYGNVTPLDLLPAVCRAVVNRRQLASWIIMGRGAEGVARQTAMANGLSGNAAGALQTGSGGGGSHGWEHIGGTWAGKSGCGGPFCGGAGSGACYGANSNDAGDFGGPGTAALIAESHATMSGGAGDPGGAGAADTLAGIPAPVIAPGGGGLLMLFAPFIAIASGCVVSADGSPSSPANWTGGCAGGGCLFAATRPGGLQNLGTMRAAGGVTLAGRANGGPGGAGSVNIFTA